MAADSSPQCHRYEQLFLVTVDFYTPCFRCSLNGFHDQTAICGCNNGIKAAQMLCKVAYALVFTPTGAQKRERGGRGR